MTKRHFDALACALLAERPGDTWDANKRVQWKLDVTAIARVASSFNPRFDRSRFLTACGLSMGQE